MLLVFRKHIYIEDGQVGNNLIKPYYDDVTSLSKITLTNIRNIIIEKIISNKKNRKNIV